MLDETESNIKFVLPSQVMLSKAKLVYVKHACITAIFIMAVGLALPTHDVQACAVVVPMEFAVFPIG